MSGYLYRGTSLSSANSEEFGTGRIEGTTATIYKGRLDAENPHSTVARGTPLEEVPWWRPEPDYEGRLWLEEQQGVTGGLTDAIGAAISFASGIPIVLYFSTDGLNGRDAPVQYTRDWFDGFPGALSWVYGQSVSGEIHAQEEGLIGLTTETEDGPQVWVWGDRDIESAARQYQDEREALVFADHIEVERALEAVGIWLEGRLGPKNVLAEFDGYHTGYGGDDEVDISEWPDARVVRHLHEEVRAAAAMDLPPLATVDLNTTVMENVYEVTGEQVDVAYTEESGPVAAHELRPFLLGNA